MSQNNEGAAFFAGLVIGGLVGAALALLLAPQSGEETRAQIRDKSLEYKDWAEEGYVHTREQMQEQTAAAYEKGRQSAMDAYEKGRQSAVDTLEKSKQAVARTGSKDGSADAAADVADATA